MKIEITDVENKTDRPNVSIQTQVSDVNLSEVYTGVGIKTEQGLFGVSQRDGGIEVMLDGKLVWSSFDLEENVESQKRTGLVGAFAKA